MIYSATETENDIDGDNNLEDVIDNLDIVKNIDGVYPENDKPFYSKAKLVGYFPDKEDDINGCFDGQGDVLEDKQQLKDIITDQVSCLLEPYINKESSINVNDNGLNIELTNDSCDVCIHASDVYFSKKISSKVNKDYVSIERNTEICHQDHSILEIKTNKY